ncbi:hypothetical protein BDF14DRAFT_1874672 [Spinellus fusiger]|nr:hypothetical protein BDF14DRAFT_1874672 [Spinellus fusiger]
MTSQLPIGTSPPSTPCRPSPHTPSAQLPPSSPSIPLAQMQPPSPNIPNAMQPPSPHTANSLQTPRPYPPPLRPSFSANTSLSFAQPYYPPSHLTQPDPIQHYPSPVRREGGFQQRPPLMHHGSMPNVPHHYPDPRPRPSLPPPPPPTDNHIPDSSLAVAMMAGKRQKKTTFPPATPENISKFREEAKLSNDPRLHLDLAKYLLEAISQVQLNDNDPKRAKQIKDAMSMEAQKITKRLATQSSLGKTGYPEAQFFLGTAYTGGLMSLPVDHERAFGLYMQGSKQGHPGCTYRTAVCYEVGAGTKRDKAHAIQLYRKAATLGEPSAMYKLGMILLIGHLGQPKNPKEGVAWLKKAATFADEDHPHALHELGLAYEKEGIPSVITDLNYARDLFTQAAQYGYPPSQFKLGLAYEHGHLYCPVDPRRSIAWYSKAAEQGNSEAALGLSGWYLTGAPGILQPSDQEAYLWARKAADNGYPKAEYAVGYYTETGIGVRPHLEDAKKWYMRAAAQEYKRAMQRLTEIQKAGGSSRPQRQRHTRDPNGVPSAKDSDCSLM